MMTCVSIQCDAESTPLVLRAGEVFTRTLRERGGLETRNVKGDKAGAGRADVVLAIEPGIGTEGFRIGREGTHGGWRIAGNDERGLFYGVGRFLRGCDLGGLSPHRESGLTYAGWQGTSVPRMPVRGMYFATHFHNFYHDAPVEQIERYVEELALWGCNALSVWFDMHHYAGIADPAALSMIARLHAILKAAKGVGMTVGLMSIANEAYHTSPVELRAEPFPHHYHVEICPARPGGLDLILKWRREMLDAFADLDIGYVWIWPYDQGGCKCPDCKPWGGNGFVHNAEAVGQLVRRMLPGAKTVISTWEFGYWEGDPEWDLFYAAMARRPDWVDYILAEGHGDFPPYIRKHGPPPGYPVLNFPEISMRGMWPWGGFGVNLQPARLQKVWDTCRHWLSGGFPYSEGIYEDLNKAVCLQLYWDPDRPVEDIVREYAASEFAAETAEKVVSAVYQLESNMKHSVRGKDALMKQLHSGGSGGATGALYGLPAVQDPECPLALLDAATMRMSPRARQAWRWRLLWLRAALDLELSRSGGQPTDRTDKYFEEICRISHADGAEWAVCVPSRRTLKRLLE